MSQGGMLSQARPRRRRWWGRVLLALGAACIVIPPLLVEVVPDRPPPPASPSPAAGGTASISRYRVFVADWGYHTSIILEQPDGSEFGPAGHERARFVEYAWGDRRYYMEADHRPHSLLAALLLPTESVAYVAAWDAPPDSAARPRALHVRTVTAAELAAVMAAVERQIRHAGSGSGERVAPFPPTPAFTGRFYPAYGHYLWWSDCNRWTVDRLAEAGLARSGRGVIFSGQVGSRLRGFRAVGAQPNAHQDRPRAMPIPPA